MAERHHPKVALLEQVFDAFIHCSRARSPESAPHDRPENLPISGDRLVVQSILYRCLTFFEFGLRFRRRGVRVANQPFSHFAN